MTTPQPRRTLATYGPRGATVRVLIHDEETIRVQWYEGPKGHKQRRSKDWPNTTDGRKEARAWAKGFADVAAQPREREHLTLRTLWEKYAEAEFPHLRARSQALYAENWRYWERMWGRAFAAESATLEMVDQFRGALRARKLAVSTIGEAIRTVKRVYRWGHKRRLLGANPVADYEYRIAKDERRESPAEYSAAEFQRLLAALDPASGSQWRAHVALALCGHQGVRQRAALHLQWADMDEAAGELVWRAQWDKMGREWRQPMREGTKAALVVARRWRERSGYRGPWVIPAGSSKSKRDGTYSPQSLWGCLKRAELRAKVPQLERRGAHGLRRLLAGEVNALTGDATLAMHAIGDTDLRVMSRYLKKRDGRIRDAFARLDAGAEVPAEPASNSPDFHGHRHQTVSAAGSTVVDPEEGAE